MCVGSPEPSRLISGDVTVLLGPLYDISCDIISVSSSAGDLIPEAYAKPLNFQSTVKFLVMVSYQSLLFTSKIKT